MIRETSLETLKSQIDIVDILSDHIELKKAGANFKTCCPFHGETTASFVVSPAKQICHCFGCGYSSDAIGFIQEHKKLSFVEAVEDVANSMNFTLEYAKESNKKNYSKVMEFIKSYYISKMDKKTHKYLTERGVTDQSIQTFEIGLAPDSSLQIQTLNDNMFSGLDAVECGILATDDNGNNYARLTNRISFPIRNHTGKLIGFGGRILSGERAKYLNSPQTPLFDKSRNLYGYNLAKEHIYRKGTFTVVEGYLDVILLHQIGVETAVATMGTALTEMHCNIIAKSQANALLCFDGDKAGVSAAFKASKLLSGHGIFGGVVLFPEGKDPADMIRENKRVELFEMMLHPVALIEFVISHIAGSYNLNEPREKQEALSEVMAFTKTLTPFIQDEYKSYVSKVLNINVSHVTVARQSVPSQVVQLQAINISEMNIINSATDDDENKRLVLSELTASMFLYHSREFLMFKQNSQELLGLLLRDELSLYTLEELKSQIKVMKISHYQRELQNIITSDESFDRKSFEIKKMKGVIYELRKGDRNTTTTTRDFLNE